LSYVPDMGMILLSMGTIDVSVPAGVALLGRTRAAVLALLYDHTDTELYLSEIVRAVGAGTGAVQRELARLTAAGLLRRTTRGKQVYFQANLDSPVFPEIHGLIVKTIGAVGVLREALAPLGSRVRLALIYGSVARGAESVSSDVDLLVIGTARLFDVVSALAPAQEKLRREINPVVFPAAEARRKLRTRDPFLAGVAAGAKLFVIGGDHELADLGG
jgi:predicted nucleotidyltransferase